MHSSGLAAFKRTLGSDGAAAGFAVWRDQMMTKMVSDVIRDFILNQPLPGLNSEEVAVQYGITQGLEVAYPLIQDPSGLIPGIFGRGTQPGADGVKPPEETFDTPSDDVLGK